MTHPPSATDRRLRVLSVCETAKGGIATYLRLLHGETSAAAQHRVILPASHRGELGTGMDIADFPDAGRGIRRLWRLSCITLREMRRQPPDIVFFHSTFTLPLMMALRLLRRPGRFIYCAHGWAALRYPARSLRRWLIARAEGFMCGFSDRIVNISAFERAHARQAHYRGAHVLIENAVADEAAAAESAPFARSGETLNLLFIGRFDRQKGLDVLLAAFKKVREQRSDLRLHVVGESVLNDSPHLQGVNDHLDVCFHGWKAPSDVQAFCSAADLVVVPSRWEGFGLVVAEALRSGTPVLVSDRSALPELIEPGVSGLVFEFGIDALAEALAGLDRQQLTAMRPACRARYEARFQARRFGEQLSTLFRELTA
jgi:glycosyltransferase involved in cell wall biosynthesis